MSVEAVAVSALEPARRRFLVLQQLYQRGINDLNSMDPDAILAKIPPQHKDLRMVVEARLSQFVALYVAKSKLYASLNQILREMSILYRRDIRGAEGRGSGRTFDAKAIRGTMDLEKLGAMLSDAETALAEVSFDD